MGRDRDPPRWLHSFGVAVTPGKSVTQGAGCPAQQNRPADQRIVATVEVREALGAETLIHFSIAAPTVESGDPDALDELGEVDAGRCTARFSAATRARVGDHIQINVTPEHLYFFDPGDQRMKASAIFFLWSNLTNQATGGLMGLPSRDTTDMRVVDV